MPAVPFHALPDDARLSDRTRATVLALLTGVVAAAEAEIRRHAARLLGDDALAATAGR